MHDDAVEVAPGAFEPEQHFYSRVLNAQLHPMVRDFMALSNERRVIRYRHLRPHCNGAALAAYLTNPPAYFRWGGADLFLTTTDGGARRIVVVETNSCPSGQKSMPSDGDLEEQAGYRVLLERSFVPMLKRRSLPQGDLAVIYDKNFMEASGYAATLADLTGEHVHLIPCFDGTAEPLIEFRQRVLYVRYAPGAEWIPIRAAFRYVTQRPWNRIPPLTKTLIYNPILACLAGGRNKLLAAKAYDVFNGTLEGEGLELRSPETIWDVTRDEVPMWIQRMGGVGVVKVPYSNAGQGVYTITNAAELEAFMELEMPYEQLIVQSLVGNSSWSSIGKAGRFYHVGTVPDRRGRIFASDLRFMVGVSPDGFFPVAIYARRARSPLTETLSAGQSSWDMLGTNLSVKLPDGSWTTESERLRLMDQRDFNRLGIGMDDLIDGYIQTVLAVTAIDRLAQNLVTQKRVFRRKLFHSLNPDARLAAELMNDRNDR